MNMWTFIIALAIIYGIYNLGNEYIAHGCQGPLIILGHTQQ